MSTFRRKPTTNKANKQAILASMHQWPASWAATGDDVEPGKRLVEHMRPFVIHLLEEGYSATTVRCHLNNLWAIGGEVVRQFTYDPPLRRRSARQLLLDAVGADDSPLLPDASEPEQRSADSTARKLHRFLRSGENGTP